MSRHIIEITDLGRNLSLNRGFLVITARDTLLAQVPLDDVLALILTAPDSSLSKQVMVALAERGSVIVIGGKNFHPIAMMLPNAQHHEQTGVQLDQVSTSLPLKKRLWQQLVRAKIAAQAWVLSPHEGKESRRTTDLLLQMVSRVASGDPENLEAQAAKAYWTVLMGASFRRDPNKPGINAHLNYGYAVLRASLARSVVAVGLNPALGIFHRSRRNPYCLVDDLMEPFRPFVDRQVALWGLEKNIDLIPERKRALAALLELDMESSAGLSPLRNCCQRLAQSLVRSHTNKRAELDLPFFPTTTRLL